MPSKTYYDFVTEAKQRIQQVTPQDAIAMQQRGDPAVFVDCREANEWNLGHIPGALFIPRGILESNIERAASRDQKVILYCASGNRSALAADTLQQMGYTDVASMARGIRGWVEEGGDLEG
jgi:sulfur-carrier protein adenylyltransferase/sulfurtransferase